MKNKKYFRKSAWIYIEERQVLVVRSKGNKVFFLPGGGSEKDETKEQALIRELREELSVDIKEGTIKYIGTFEAPSFEFPKNITIRMDCFFAEYSGRLVSSSEVEEFAWFKYEDKQQVSSVDRLVFDYLKQTDLIV